MPSGINFGYDMNHYYKECETCIFWKGKTCEHCEDADMYQKENKMRVEYKYKLEDYKVVSTTVLTSYDPLSGKNFDTERTKCYELYRPTKMWFREVLGTPITRLQTLEEVNEYLLIETGTNPDLKD